MFPLTQGGTVVRTPYRLKDIEDCFWEFEINWTDMHHYLPTEKWKLSLSPFYAIVITRIHAEETGTTHVLTIV